MIPYPPKTLSSETAAMLASWQAIVDSAPDFESQVLHAKAEFRRRNVVSNRAFREVRTTLAEMSGGTRRCMYCEDSRADEVEHHHPKTLYPNRTFDWDNYLYSCGGCNVRKGNRFAVLAPTGAVHHIVNPQSALPAPPPPGTFALVDPRQEDPLDFLMLDIARTFVFVPYPDPESIEYVRAKYTIDTLHLNSRDDLQESRRVAFVAYRSMLAEYRKDRDGGAQTDELTRIRNAIARMPHPTVWREMKRQRDVFSELRLLFQEVPEALGWV